MIDDDWIDKCTRRNDRMIDDHIDVSIFSFVETQDMINLQKRQDMSHAH